MITYISVHARFAADLCFPLPLHKSGLHAALSTKVASTKVYSNKSADDDGDGDGDGGEDDDVRAEQHSKEAKLETCKHK